MKESAPDNRKKTGPATKAGKESVRHNAFKHGLRANSLVNLPKVLQESAGEYEALTESLRESIKPQSEFEEFCIHSIANGMFRLRRAEALEASLFTTTDNGFRVEYCEKPKIKLNSLDQLDLVLRYRTAISNEITKALSAIHAYRHYFQMELFGKGGENADPKE